MADWDLAPKSQLVHSGDGSSGVAHSQGLGVRGYDIVHLHTLGHGCLQSSGCQEKLIRDLLHSSGYARIDDDDEGITNLRRSLEIELRKQTGEALPIFQDRRDIFIGQQWRDRIMRSIDGSSLLVVVITPSLLRSDFCRVEIEAFAGREDQLGRSDLIIPILYIRTPGLSNPEDDVATILDQSSSC